MVIRAQDSNRFLVGALAASLCVHLVIALFLPVWTPAQSEGLQPIEALSFARVIRVQMQRLASATRPVTVPDTNRRARKVSFARHKSELTAKNMKRQARPSAVNGPMGPVAAAPKRVLASRPAPLFARAPASSAPLTSNENVSAPSPQPQNTVGPHAVGGAGASDRGGALPLGAAQDPILDPGVRSQLQKIVSGHVTLIVTVGEDGHTKRVVFEPPIDPQAERDIQAILAQANWDAAVCGGGVTCDGVATIKL